MANEIAKQYEEKLNTPTETIESKGSEILFGEYIKNWLEGSKPTLEVTTYSSYKGKIAVITDYFNDLGIRLIDLKKSHIKAFYQYLVSEKGLKIQTVKRYHANIHKSLKEAVELELITVNPASNMKLDKAEQYIASHYNKSELEDLFEKAKNSPIELHILIASYYGLRRSEVCRFKMELY